MLLECLEFHDVTLTPEMKTKIICTKIQNWLIQIGKRTPSLIEFTDFYGNLKKNEISNSEILA